MYSANLISKWFLQKDRQVYAFGDSDGISNLKLQKLLYYAQGAYYAITGKLLFADPIVAWTHGPVVESEYCKYSDNGSAAIDLSDDFGLSEADFDELSGLDRETKSILEEVYDTFGQYSAWKLREMTREETPWQTTPRNGVISNEKIKDCIKKLYVEEA
jgi:uncharacterized phage-associated protein